MTVGVNVRRTEHGGYPGRSEAWTPEEYRRLVDWFRSREQTRWDGRMDQDSIGGKLDFQFAETESECAQGLVRDWPPPSELWRLVPHHPSFYFRRLRSSEHRFSVRLGDQLAAAFTRRASERPVKIRSRHGMGTMGRIGMRLQGGFPVRGVARRLKRGKTCDLVHSS
jgi:hypothetical protein